MHVRTVLSFSTVLQADAQASCPTPNSITMSTKENNEVAVEKVTENDKASGDAKCEIKGIKRPAEVSSVLFSFFLLARRSRNIISVISPRRLYASLYVHVHTNESTYYTPAYTTLPRHAARLCSATASSAISRNHRD